MGTASPLIAILPRFLRRDGFWGLLLGLLLLVTYYPVWHAGFLWDDQLYITENPYLNGWAGLKTMWTTSVADISPLTFTTFWVEHALWGLNPLPYHLINLFFHIADAILLWKVLRNLQVPGAWLGAALWALHPVEVESVAWVTETKNTESGLFFLLSLLLFLRVDGPVVNQSGNNRQWNYAGSILCAALAMACKTSTVVLPVVLCLASWWKAGRWSWRTLGKTVPFFFLSLVASALSLWTQKLQLLTVTDPLFVRTWPERVATAGMAFWFYLGKLLWPHPLISVYPRWHIDASRWESYLPTLAMIVALAVLGWKRRSWGRPWFFAYAYFLVALLPVLGLFDNAIFRYSFVFDHLQYLASMGPLALAGAGLFQWLDTASSSRRWMPITLAGGLLLLLALLSWQRAAVFESGETLWSDTLAKDPDNWSAHNNLGNAFFKAGRMDEAQTEFRRTLQIYPDAKEARYNLGRVLLEKGQIDDAIVALQNDIQAAPADDRAHTSLGLAFAQKGRMDEAISQYQQALQINPNSSSAHDNLGVALFRQGHREQAISHLQRALEIEPGSDEAHNNLANAFLMSGRLDEAVDQYRAALAINPSFIDAHRNLGVALWHEGKTDEALLQFQIVVQLRPNDPYAQSALAKLRTPIPAPAAPK
jgi:tetratricopeptide (TPR) repeat protein